MTSSPRSRPEPKISLRERKKVKTRAAIQTHALRLFREQGYAKTSVEQIAEAAEVSPSTFFRYFPTKEDTVLSDFIDSTIVELVVDAPAELSPIGAIRHALGTMFAGMTQEQMDLEMQRNELISSIPELQRGMTAELYRPIDLMTDALCRRLHRPAGDTSVRIYSGAVVGALMAGLLGQQIDLNAEFQQRFLIGADQVLDTLERLLADP